MSVINTLIEDEGIKLKPYKDTVGCWTIGCGRNLDDVGISYQEAMLLLQNDIVRATQEAEAFWWYEQLSQARRDVIVMMIFNLGLPRFRGFKMLIRALELRNPAGAASEMLNSKWAQQNVNRVKRLAWIMEHGEYPPEHGT